MSDFKEMAVVGDRDTIDIFKPFGVVGFDTDGDKSLEDILEVALSSNFGIVWVTEDIYKRTSHIIKEKKGKTFPAVSIIPGLPGTKGIGLENLRQAVIRAVGVELKGK